MTNTANNAANNNAAASKAQNILNGNAWAKIKDFIKYAPGLITKSLNDASMKVENINSMDEEQVTKGTHEFFEALRANIQANIDFLRMNARSAKAHANYCSGLEESIKTFEALEKDILASDENIVRKVARIVLSTLVFIGVKLLQGAKKAALIIASVGIRILCIGAGFLIKFVTAVVKTGRTIVRMAKAYKNAKKLETVAEDDLEEGDIVFED